MGVAVRIPQFLWRREEDAGLLWFGPEKHWVASYTNGRACGVPINRAYCIASTLSDSIGEQELRGWAEKNGAKIDGILSRTQLFRAVIQRFTWVKSAVLVGALHERYFLALIKENNCVFDFCSEKGIAELDKALKHCMRQNRGTLPVFLLADSEEKEREIHSFAQKATGVAPQSLGHDAGTTLAAAVAKPTVASSFTLKHALATAASLLLLLGTFSADYFLRHRLDRLSTEIAANTARAERIMARAHEVDEAITIRSQHLAGGGSNTGEAIELLTFLGNALPTAATLDEVTVDVAARTTSYQGIRVADRGIPTTSPRFAIRGSTRDLGSFSRVLDVLNRSSWRVEQVEDVSEAGSDTQGLSQGYGFKVALRKVETL